MVDCVNEPVNQGLEREDKFSNLSNFIPPISEMDRVAQQLKDLVFTFEEPLLAGLRNGETVEFKEGGDIVTEMDRKIEHTIQSEIKKILPEAGFLGEETAPFGKKEFSEIFEKEWLVIVDPIDGTANYANQLPFFATSIGVFEKTSEGFKPRLGTVLMPATHELFYNNSSTAYIVDTLSGAEREIPQASVIEPGKAIIIAPTSFNKYYELNPDSGLNKNIRQISCAVGNLLYTVTGRSAGTMIRAKFWDFAGPMAIGATLGVSFRDFETGEKKTAFGPEDFVGRDGEPTWGLSKNYLVSTEENYEILKDAIMPRQ